VLLWISSRPSWTVCFLTAGLPWLPSTCISCTNSMGSAKKFIRNAEAQAPTRTCAIRICN
jgi:hypothetical protein